MHCLRIETSFIANPRAKAMKNYIFSIIKSICYYTSRGELENNFIFWPNSCGTQTIASCK